LNKKTTVLYNPEWHKGVLGIVASRIIETFYRPTVILTKSNGFITGSARSVQGFDLYKAVDACSHLLVNFGGHMFAAGLTLKEENLEEFTKQFEKFVSENITEEQQIPQIEVDAKIKFQEITPKFHRILKQFQPFGPENMKPIFVTEDVSDLGGGKVVGKTLEHLKLDLVSEDSPSKIFPAIGFGMAKYSDVLMKKRNFNICYSIEDNEFMGNTSLQLLIKDIQI
jgi:single-stranded-DNA-specific exonuclease